MKNRRHCKTVLVVDLTRGIEKRMDGEKLIAKLSRIVYDHRTKK